MADRSVLVLMTLSDPNPDYIGKINEYSLLCSCNIIVNCFFLIFDVIFSTAKGVQHDGRLPFWKPPLCLHIMFVF